MSFHVCLGQWSLFCIIELQCYLSPGFYVYYVSQARTCVSVRNCHNPPFFSFIHCNFCLNLHITHGYMEENVSGCFFWTQCTIIEMRFGRVECSLLKEHPSHSVCQTSRQYLVSSGFKSDAGYFMVETVELRAAFAASSARSLPWITVWPGNQIRVIDFPLSSIDRK